MYSSRDWQRKGKNFEIFGAIVIGKRLHSIQIYQYLTILNLKVQITFYQTIQSEQYAIAAARSK